MYQLGVNAACAFVRTALDELTTVEEIGFLVDADAVNLQRIVENCIVEAVVRTHQNALPLLIDGVEGVDGVDFDAKYENDGSVTITMLQDTLRIASVRTSDPISPVVCTLVAEDSPKGRMQMSKYTRGVYDDPCVVLAKVWNDTYQSILRYYSVDGKPEIYVEYIPYPVITDSMVNISARLEYAVLNEIVAMVLDSVNEHQKAALYRAKSQAIMEGK